MLDRSGGAQGALAAVTALLAVVEAELRESGGADRRVLLVVGARAAEFAGFCHRDLGEARRCLGWHDRAMEWAQQADDVAMQSYVLLRKAQAAYDQRDAPRMLALTIAAQGPAERLGRGLRAEIVQQRARGEAMLGAAESDVRRQLDDARALLDTGEGRDADELGREYGPKLLELQAGLCLTEAGRPAEAVPVYDAVIADGATSERDRAYFRILQATSLALAGEPDRAAEQGRAALPVAVAAGSLRSVAEARTLLGVLAPWRQRTPVREFAAAVRETSGGGSVR